MDFGFKCLPRHCCRGPAWELDNSPHAGLRLRPRPGPVLGVKRPLKAYCNQTARKKAAGWLVRGMGSRLKPPEVMVLVLTGTQLPLVSEVLISMRYVVPVVPVMPMAPLAKSITGLVTV